MPEPLFDTTALSRNRARAATESDDAMFLHLRAAGEIEERLNMVNRRFTKVTIVSGLPVFWRRRFPGARHVRAGDDLGLAAQSADLVVHALALHGANDPVGQMIQCRRALVPDGLFLGVLFGGETLAELRHALATAESRVASGLRPRVAPMADLRDIGALLSRAGFALPVADSDSLSLSYSTLAALMHDLRRMGEANALAARCRHFTRRGLFTLAEAVCRERFAAPEGRFSARFEMIHLAGWAPSDDQPRPLRPGSAKMRLADALADAQKEPAVTDRPAKDTTNDPD